MRVVFKLYASLGDYLPAGAEDHQIALDVADGTSPMDLFIQHGLPLDDIHLVMVNGVFVPPGERTDALSANDELAVWPAVAGG